MSLPAGKLPIYHVHGFVPIRSKGSSGSEITLTEDQFHEAALNPLSWLNLVQVQALTRSPCLMVGMSLTDRNQRRLLEALRRIPERPQHYAILQRRAWPKATQTVTRALEREAAARRKKFEESGAPAAFHPPSDLDALLREVQRAYHQEQTRVLQELGIEPLWYDDHAEAPQILRSIAS